MHAKHEVSVSYVSKVIVKVNLTTDRQDKNMPPIYECCGQKIGRELTEFFTKEPNPMIRTLHEDNIACQW